MNTLIVEDDLNKYEQIFKFISENYTDIEIVYKKSYQDGLREILQNKYDLIILDMSLPTYEITAIEEGGPFLTFAGEDILSEMQRKKVFTNVIVMTQFDTFGEGNEKVTLNQLRDNLCKRFKNNYTKTIFYEASEKNWKDELSLLINSIFYLRDAK